MTGLKLVTVDDHINRLVEDGQLRRPVAGVVEIVEPLMYGELLKEPIK